jgi:Condensation domain/TubC N-terminal docking domain
MQSTVDFLTSLLRRGIAIWSAEGEIYCRTTKGILLPEELQRIRARKKEILEILEGGESESDAPLRSRAPGCLVPLSPIQRRLFNSVFTKTGLLSVRMLAVVANISGPLNVNFLRASINAVVSRHESLRTRVAVVDGTPRQLVDESWQSDLEVVDLLGVPETDVHEEVQRRIEKFVDEPVDLAVGPLFSARLYRLLDREYALCMALDHIISDAVSQQILYREVWTAYRQLESGEPISLSKLLMQFADYAVWQEASYPDWLARHAEYWKERMTNVPRTEIPVVGPGAELRQASASQAQFSFGKSLSKKLREMARREKALPALVVFSVYVAVMSKWCNQHDVVVLFVSHGRSRPELMEMIGAVAEAIFLRLEVNGHDVAVDLVRRASKEFLLATVHPDFGRVPDIIPGMKTELYFNWGPADWWQWSQDCSIGRNHELEIRGNTFRKPVALSLACFFVDCPEEITCKIEYRSDLHGVATIEKFWVSLKLFAEELVRCPVADLESMLGKLPQLRSVEGDTTRVQNRSHEFV